MESKQPRGVPQPHGASAVVRLRGGELYAFHGHRISLCSVFRFLVKCGQDDQGRLVSSTGVVCRKCWHPWMKFTGPSPIHPLPSTTRCCSSRLKCTHINSDIDVETMSSVSYFLELCPHPRLTRQHNRRQETSRRPWRHGDRLYGRKRTRQPRDRKNDRPQGRARVAVRHRRSGGPYFCRPLVSKGDEASKGFICQVWHGREVMAMIDSVGHVSSRNRNCAPSRKGYGSTSRVA